MPPNLKPRVNWYAKGAFTIFADQFAQIWYDTAMNNFFRPVNIYHLLTERKTPKVIFNMRLHEVIRDTETNEAMRSKLQDTVSLTMGNWDLSLLQSADNLKVKSVQRFVHLSPRYNHVTLISGYLFFDSCQ